MLLNIVVLVINMFCCDCYYRFRFCFAGQLMDVLKAIKTDLRQHMFDTKPKVKREVSLTKTLEHYIQKHLSEYSLLIL